MTASDSFSGIIAYLRGCDKVGARSFCEEVQGYCIQEPSVADIGEAIRQLGDSDYDTRDVAKLASELRGWVDNIVKEVAMDEETITINTDELEKALKKLKPETFAPIQIDLEAIHQATQQQRDAYLKAVAESVRKQLFSVAINGNTIGVIGDGPFDSGNLENFITKLGATVDHQEIPWGEQDYIVIGRANYNTGYLEESLGNAPGIQYFSQEDFLKFLLFGIEPGYVPGDPRIAAHPGLTFLSSASIDDFKWPEVDLTLSETDGEVINTGRWQEEHRLRSEFGYNVSKREGLTAQQRRHRLKQAIQDPPRGLGLYQVATHIAGMIRLNKNRRNWESALRKWRSDLDWLYKKHYKGRGRSFQWPDSDI